MLIINSGFDPIETVAIIQSVVDEIKKKICSGKQGEAAMKFYQDGSLICPADTILDNLKIIEEAINNSGFKENVKIGLSMQADLFYNPELKKYELDNPKQLLDIDQLVLF